MAFYDTIVTFLFGFEVFLHYVWTQENGDLWSVEVIRHIKVRALLN